MWFTYRKEVAMSNNTIVFLDKAGELVLEAVLVTEALIFKNHFDEFQETFRKILENTLLEHPEMVEPVSCFMQSDEIQNLVFRSGISPELLNKADAIMSAISD